MSTRGDIIKQLVYSQQAIAGQVNHTNDNQFRVGFLGNPVIVQQAPGTIYMNTINFHPNNNIGYPVLFFPTIKQGQTYNPFYVRHWNIFNVH